VAVVISDFLDDSGYEQGLRLLSSLGHDVFVVHVTSERERHVEACGEVRVVDTESGDTRDIDVTPELARAYDDAWQRHVEGLQTYCGQYRLAYVRADAEDPFDDVILRTFREGGFLA
jgi:hypothetical protein